MTLSVGIAEDEPLARARLYRFLSKLESVESIHIAEDGEQALELIKQYQLDLFILDINMPKMTGLEVASHIEKSDLRPPAIIFATAYDEFALDAFKVNAMAYLMKPVQEDELHNAVARAGQLNRIQANEANSIDQGSLLLKKTSTIESLKLSEIVYFRATDKLVLAGMVSGDESVIGLSLKHLEEKLMPAFVRVHRHTLVNTNFLKSLEKDDDGGIRLSLECSEKSFQVSRRQIKTLKEVFLQKNI